MTNILISLLNNYIINIVRSIRLELDITQQDLSRQITPYSETNLVGLIESDKTVTTYNDNHLNIIVRNFSEKAKLLGKEKTDYTIYDLYPTKALPEQLITKTIDLIPKGLQATGALNLLLEKKTLFFDEWHTVKEITIYCNNFTSRDWKTTDFTSVVARAEESGKLIRSSENDPKYKIA
jgi:hypothetical protein